MTEKTAKKTNNVSLQELHKVAMDQFNKIYHAEVDQRDLSIEDTRFVNVEGSQWDDFASNQRQNRPRYEVNKIALPRNQIIGDFLQMNVGAKVRPYSGGATKELADTFNGLIRHIEVNSDFDKIKHQAFADLTDGGYGAWYVTTEFTDDDSFEQDVKLKFIPSPASSVYFDPVAIDPQKKDAKYCFVVTDMARKEFEKRWPNSGMTDMEQMFRPVDNSQNNWYSKETVRVADYWLKVPVRKEIAKLSNNTVVEVNDDLVTVMDELAAQGITIATDGNGNPLRRSVMTHKVVHYKMSGSEILEGPHEWAGKYIPVVPVYGFSKWINGKHFWRGIVRFAKDAQRVYNYATSNAIEVAALSPKDPYWLTPTQAKGHEKQLREFNVKNSPFMLYNHDPVNPGPPTRTGAPAVQQALITQVQQADMDIQATTGRFAPSLGQNPREESGKALLAQQEKGDLGTYELTYSMVKAIEYTGEILIDLLPKVWDTERQVRTVSEEGDTEIVEINKTVYDVQSGQNKIINDLSQGKYSVSADAGPSYKSKRIEATNLLSTLMENNELFSQVAPDLLAKNFDFPFAEELTERVRKVLLDQGIVEPNEEEMQAIMQQQMMQAQQGQQLDPLTQEQIIQMKMQSELLERKIEEQELKNREIEVDIENKIADTQKKLSEVTKNRSDAISEGALVLTPDLLEAEKTNMNNLNNELATEGTGRQDQPEEDVVTQQTQGNIPAQLSLEEQI